MKYRLSDLRNFLETSYANKLTLAAQKLEISQPALSGSIKRLEELHGYQLFYRSKQGIQLTPNGRFFQERVKNALGVLESLEEAGPSKNIFEGSAITIGCHPVVAQYSLPRALTHLKEAAPDYKINLVHDLSRKILNEIQFGRIDIGILINPIKVPDLVIRTLAFDKIGIWRSKKTKSFDTVICEQDLFQTQSILKRWKQKPARIIQTSSLELTCHLVASDIGWGIIPQKAVELSGLDLHMESQMPTFKDEICLVHRPEFGRAPAEKLMIDSLKFSFK